RICRRLGCTTGPAGLSHGTPGPQGAACSRFRLRRDFCGQCWQIGPVAALRCAMEMGVSMSASDDVFSSPPRARAEPQAWAPPTGQPIPTAPKAPPSARYVAAVATLVITWIIWAPGPPTLGIYAWYPGVSTWLVAWAMAMILTIVAFALLPGGALRRAGA